MLLLSVAACNRNTQSKDAVRQGVIDYLSERKDLNIGSMDVTVTDVKFTGDKADATVSFAPKGTSPSQGMTMRYQLEQKGNNWVVVGRQDSGHSGAVAPGAANPHGGGVMPGAAPGGAAPGGAIPSPEDLPPASGKK